MSLIDSVRSNKVAGTAIFDWVATYIAAYFIQRQFPRFVYGTLHFQSPMQWYLFMIPLAVIVHYLFQTHTPMTNAVLRDEGWNLWKSVNMIAIIIIFILAIKSS